MNDQSLVAYWLYEIGRVVLAQLRQRPGSALVVILVYGGSW